MAELLPPLVDGRQKILGFHRRRGPNTRNRCSDMWEKEIQPALVDFGDGRAAAFLFCPLMCVIWTFRYF
jgi:hypothetical protein